MITLATNILVLLLPQTAESTTSPPADPIAKRLAKAQASYEASTGKARAALLGALQLLAESSADSSAKERAALDRAAFEARGVLPASCLADCRAFENDTLASSTRLLAAYERAITAYKDSSQHQAAGSLQQELDRLQAEIDALAWRDLRCLIDLSQHDPAGAWKWRGPSLVAEAGNRGVLQIPAPPAALRDGYDLRIAIERTAGKGDAQLLFPTGSDPKRDRGLLILGGWDGSTSGLELIDDKAANDNDTTFKGSVFTEGKTATIVFTCTSDKIRVTVNQREIIRWRPSRALALPPGLASEFPGDTAMRLITSPDAAFRIDGIAFRDLKTQKPRRTVATATAKPEPEDHLAKGNRWFGKNGGGATVTITVQQRDQRRKTATLLVVTEGNMRFRFSVSTNKTGSSLTIRRVRRLDRGRHITHEQGSGTITNQRLKMSWGWTTDAPRGHIITSNTFSGART